jgi:hypothetical protein
VWRRANDIYIYDAGTVDLDDGVGAVRITGSIHYYGGTLTPPANSQIMPYMSTEYAGASDAKIGIAPQTINNTTVAGDAVYLGPNDRLDIYCNVGAIDAGGAVAYALYEDDASDFTGEAAVSGKTASFDDGDDNQTKIIQVWGYELTAGKPYCRVKATESGTQNALVTAVCVKHLA